jgi:hypothetical protein
MNDKTEKTQKLMTRPQAAHYITSRFGIPMSPLTLEKKFSQGSQGPKCIKFGRRIFYDVADLDEWVKNGTSRKFTPLMLIFPAAFWQAMG